MLTADTEPGFDHVLVEAHTPGQEDWTTLADLNVRVPPRRPREARTARQLALFQRLHPFLAHYFSGADCDAPGTSGVWNSFTGSTGGSREVAFDLLSVVGGHVELWIALVTDEAELGAGVRGRHADSRGRRTVLGGRPARPPAVL